MHLNVHAVVENYINTFLNVIELDQKVSLAQNIVIMCLSFGPFETQNVLNCLDQIYENQSEEIQNALAIRLGDLLRLTSYDQSSIPGESVERFFHHMDNLSNLNSYMLNKSLKQSFERALTFLQNLDPAVAFVQKILTSQNTIQRAFCVSIIPSLYGKLPADEQVHKPKLGTSFGSLISDPDSFVRAEAALSLQQLINQALQSQQIDKYVYTPSYIFVCYDRLVQDLSDNVRDKNVNNGVLVLKLLLQLKDGKDGEAKTMREVKEVLPGLIKNISRGSSDRYWAIRHKTSIEMPAFFDLIHKKLDIQDCAIMFRLLCEDCEQDNRIVTIKNAHKILAHLDQNTIVQVFCPTLLVRAGEKESLKVKLALAQELGEIARILPQIKQQEEVISVLKQTLSEAFLKLFADKIAEVRLVTADQIDAIYRFVSVEAATDVINQIVTSKTEKWVVKCKFVEAVGRLVQAGIDVKQIVEDMSQLIADEAFKTREQVALTIGAAACEYGVEWFSGLLERLTRLARGNTSNFQIRVSCALCLCSCLKAYLRWKSVSGFSEVEAVLTAYCDDKSVFVRQQVAAGARDLLMAAADLEDDSEFYGPVRQLLAALLEKLAADADAAVAEEAAELAETLEQFS